MKTLNRPGWSRIALAPFALALLLLAGCLEQHLVWSPDGKRAAVIDSENGLFLCDANGQLSAPLVPDVFRVAWFGDSQQLVLARKHRETMWASIAPVLGPERAAAIVARSDAVWQKLQAGVKWPETSQAVPMFSQNPDAKDWTLSTIYLRESHGEALREKLDPSEWDAVKSLQIDTHELVLARIVGDKIVTGTQLYEGVGEIVDVRVSPGDKAAAFVTKNNNGDDGQLWVVPVGGSQPVLVAGHVAFYPDWTADARSLVYQQSSGATAKDDLRLGTIVQREVLDAGGKIAIQAEQKDLAGCFFSGFCRVRSLRDGRIFFNAAEITLPVSAHDYGDQREQLFALDPARQSTLVRLIPRRHEQALPQTLAFFEVSPDERQVLCGWVDGTVCVLTLATGELKEVQKKTKDTLQGAPAWRNSGEFTYTRRTAGTGGKPPSRPVEIILRSGDNQADADSVREKILSQSWPDAMMNNLFSEKN